MMSPTERVLPAVTSGSSDVFDSIAGEEVETLVGAFAKLSESAALCGDVSARDAASSSLSPTLDGWGATEALVASTAEVCDAVSGG